MNAQSKQRRTKETEGALIARRTKEVELAKVLSTTEATERLKTNGHRAKAKAAEERAKENLKAAGGQVVEPASSSKPAKAAAPRQRAGEWFFGQTQGPDTDPKKPLGPFESQMEALEEARKRWPKFAARLTRKLSRFVRVGVWLNTAKLASGDRLKWHATTREGNEGLFNLPKPAPSKS
jgi:hypothetical protein